MSYSLLSIFALRFVSVVIASALLSACTTVQRPATVNPFTLLASIQIDDQVDCTLDDGSHAIFAVTAVSPTALHGTSRIVPLAEIVQIEIKRFSTKRTTWLVVGLAAGSVMAYGTIAAAASSGVFSGGGR